MLVLPALAGAVLAGCRIGFPAGNGPVARVIPEGVPITPIATLAAGATTGEEMETLVLSPTPEPIVPTPTGETPSDSDRVETLMPASTMQPVTPVDGRERFGVCGDIADLGTGALGIGWYLTWGVRTEVAAGDGPIHWQMVRVSEGGFWPEAGLIRQAARGIPGAVWLIGNEPDVRWQDNTTPERYAELYHELYELLKSADPTCLVAIGGVSQPTPLRLQYLDRVLTAYLQRYGAPMPVDIWNMHNFILREERDSWGVGIPPGFDVAVGTLREIDDHDDMDIFLEQIVGFRRWMAARGQRDRPLVVSEYGILMPVDYGFDDERVQRFMYASFDTFLTARSEEIGYPADDNRLVQYWAWYSLSSTTYPTGNLMDVDSGRLTPLGVAFTLYRPPDAEGAAY